MIKGRVRSGPVQSNWKGREGKEGVVLEIVGHFSHGVLEEIGVLHACLERVRVRVRFRVRVRVRVLVRVRVRVLV